MVSLGFSCSAERCCPRSSYSRVLLPQVSNTKGDSDSQPEPTAAEHASSRTRWRRRSSSPRCCCQRPSQGHQQLPHAGFLRNGCPTRLHDLLITRCGRGQTAGGQKAGQVAGQVAEGRGRTPRVTSVPALFLDRWLEVLSRESVGALWQSMMFLYPGWLHLPVACTLRCRAGF